VGKRGRSATQRRVGSSPYSGAWHRKRRRVASFDGQSQPPSPAPTLRRSIAPTGLLSRRVTLTVGVMKPKFGTGGLS
jgi:hypothetical protein